MEGKICTICKTWKILDDFHTANGKVTGRRPACKVCQNLAASEFRDRNRKLWYDWLDIKKKVCQNCGYDKYFSVIEFHHRDPAKKKFAIGEFMRYKFTEKNKQKLVEELNKCDVLCANCHREEHMLRRYKGDQAWKKC